MHRLIGVWVALGCLGIACSGSSSPADAGAGGGAAGGAAGGATAGGSGGGGTGGGGVPSEQEPNNGAAMGELDSITVPGQKLGAIGVANDLDIFTVALTAGEQWTWTLASGGSALAPLLSVSEAANTVPALVARGGDGGSVSLEQLVLKTGTYAIIARDSRNVPASRTQDAGSPQHTYLLSSAVSARMPQQVAVPSTTAGALSTGYASALFTFTLSTSAMVTIDVRAKTKAVPSNMDSRLTLFAKSTNQWGGTNDDLSGATTDSRLAGTLNPGQYLVVVDNVSEAANDLSFELVLSSP